MTSCHEGARLASMPDDLKSLLFFGKTEGLEDQDQTC